MGDGSKPKCLLNPKRALVGPPQDKAIKLSEKNSATKGKKNK